MTRAVQACAIAFLVAFAAHETQRDAEAATMSPGDATSRAPLAATDLLQLAIQYEHGEGVAQDYSRALELYCRAASLGDAEAFLGLGWMYLNGRGVPRDDATAALWLRKAADGGVSQASNLLEMLGDTTPSAHATCVASSSISTAQPPPAPAKIRALVQNVARSMKVDPDFVIAVIAAESAFDAMAVSRRGAKGLMQLMPETVIRFGVRDPFNPSENIRGGSSYLHWLLQRFAGDLSLTLAAYNAGEAAVDSYGGVPPFPETLEYIERVQRYYSYKAP